MATKNGKSVELAEKSIEENITESFQGRLLEEYSSHTWIARFISSDTNCNILPSSWWSQQREYELEYFFQSPGNDILQAAFSSFIDKFKAMNYTITGPEMLARQCMSMMIESDFGKGLSELLGKTTQTYLISDKGAFWEIIGTGDLDKPPQEVLGFSYLDNQYAILTDNVEYPVIYTNTKDKKPRWIHRDRVYHFVSMPSPNTRMNDTGFCLHGDSTVLTTNGYKRIKDLVDNKSTEKVISVDENGNLVEKQITNLYKNERGNRYLINIRGKYSKETKGSKEKNSWVTNDHPILTPDRGWIQAGELKTGDWIVSKYAVPNHKQTEMLIGTILGDASILQKKELARFSLSHAKKQEEWFDLKTSTLINDFGFAKRDYISKLNYKNEIKEFPQISGQTKNNAGLNFLRSNFYPEGKKVIPIDLLEKYLSPLLLTCWYLDDGHISYGRKNSNIKPFASITTQGFEKENVKAVVELLNNNGYECNAVKGRGKLNIQFTKNGSDKLFNDISPYIPNTMRYKIPEGYNEFNSSLWDLGNADRMIDEIIIQTEEDSEYKNKWHPKYVYCIDVKDTHNFITAGLVVHNCALSRILQASSIMLKLAHYKDEKLSDLPEAGLLIFNNVLPAKWDDRVQEYETIRAQKGQDYWKNLITLFGLDPTQPATANLISFANLPEAFNELQQTEIYVNLVALSLGISPNELWSLSTGTTWNPTATEVTLQHQQAKNKGVGDLITHYERALNWSILPQLCRFSFDYIDDAEDLQATNINYQKIQAIMNMWRPPNRDQAELGFEAPVPVEVIRQLLAEQVSWFNRQWLDSDISADVTLTEYDAVKHFGPIITIDQDMRVKKFPERMIEKQKKATHMVLETLEEKYKEGKITTDDLVEFVLTDLIDKELLK